MYPLGVLFGMGFDTSSEIALLGISSIQAAKGTSIWLILIFPVLFTSGMCLIDTIDGALMLTLYILPAESYMESDVSQPLVARRSSEERVVVAARRRRGSDPIAFLYYSIVLTSLTVIVALVIGTLQLLTMIFNVANPTGRFWDGVETVGEYYDVVGGCICASFVVVGILSVLIYKPWRRRVERDRWSDPDHPPEEQVLPDEATSENDGAAASEVLGNNPAPQKVMTEDDSLVRSEVV